MRTKAKSDYQNGLHAAMKRWRALPADDRARMITALERETEQQRAMGEAQIPEVKAAALAWARVNQTALAVLKAVGGARP